MKKLILTLIIIFSANLYSQEPALDSIALAEVTVTTKVVDVAKERKTPVAFSSVNAQEIDVKGGNLEVPEYLKRTPNLYQTPSTAGGYGDGELYLRGFDMNNVSVVINGQPVNDMEEGWVYWSNWAGLSDLTSSIQIQRGLSASSLAVPSVGGVVSVNTRASELEPSTRLKFLQGNDNYQKMSFSHNTGVNERGWSSSYLLSLWEGDGYLNGTEGAGITYAMTVGYTPRGGDHEFNLSILGAGQWHGQAYYTPMLEDYLDHGPTQGDDFRKFNQTYGPYKGKDYNFLTNFYNKPLATLNWDWQISNNVTLNTSIYGSAGRGGGGGDRGRNYGVTSFRRSMTDHLAGGGDAYRNADMTINWDAVVAQNVANAYIPESGPFAGMKLGYHNNPSGLPRGAFKIARYSNNSHNWFGGISKLTIDSENFRYQVGVDIRSYAGIHKRGPMELFGLDGWVTPDNSFLLTDGDRIGQVITREIEPRPFKSLNMYDPAQQRFWIGNVKWTGVNGLVEYTGSDKFSAVLQAGTTRQLAYSENFLYSAPEHRSRDIIVNGGYLKGGINYNISDRSNIFANLGTIKKPKYLRGGLLTNIVGGFDEAENIDPEEITSFEVGYGFLSSNLKANLNFYSINWGGRTLSRTSGSGADAVRYVYNGVEQLHSGFEAEVIWYPTSQLKLRGMATIGDHKYNKNFTGTGFDVNTDQPNGDTSITYLDGVKVGRHAQTIFYLGADYKITRNFSVDIDFMSFDDLYGDFGPLDSQFRSPGGSVIKLPAYSTVDAGVSYRTSIFGKRSFVRLNLNNVFDEEYISLATTNLAAEAGDRTWNGINTQNVVRFGYGFRWNLGLNIDL